MSDTEQQISTETVDKAQPPVIKKKRVMTELQRQNLVHARARALELRKALREQAGPKKPKPPTKLERRLKESTITPVVEDERPATSMPEAPPRPATMPEAPPRPAILEAPMPAMPENVRVLRQWILEPDSNGNFQMVEKEF